MPQTAPSIVVAPAEAPAPPPLRLVGPPADDQGEAAAPPTGGPRTTATGDGGGEAAELEPRPRVLVVDDEPSVRLVCRVNLSFAGFDVVEAANGAEALRAVGGDRFDVILVDVMMPGMTGFEVAEQLQETAASGVPIVFLSARADKKDIARGLSLGATEYVTKPFDPGELVDRLQAILRRGPSDGASE